MTELFSAVENNHEITDITDAYYKIIIQNVDRVCRQLTIHLSDDSDNNLFDISATLLHKYLKFRESMNDFESIATVCADFENLDNSSNNQSTSSRRLKQSINKVIIIIATLLFLAGKICESLVSMKLCVELSYKELLPNSRIDNLKIEALCKGVVEMEHQILRYIGFDATSLMNLPEAKIRKIARRENIPRYASKEAYRILDKCYFTRLCLDLDPILCAIACLYYAEHTVGGYKTTSHTINGSNNSSNYSSSGGKDFDSQISKRQKVDEIDHRTIWSSSRWWLLYEAVDESELERLRQQMMSSFNQ